MDTNDRKRRDSAVAAGSHRMTLFEAAAEFGVARTTLRRRLTNRNIKVADGETYTIAQIHAVLVDDLDVERVREVRARADLLELERQEKQRELVPLAEVQQLISDAFLPVRQRLMALPSEQCARCNPSDPQLARESLDRWLTDSLPIIRGGLPKVKKGKR